MYNLTFREMIRAKSVAGACPLKDRVMKSSGLQRLPHDLPPTSRTNTKYKDWDEERLMMAVKAVQDMGYSVRRAAEEHGVPKSTLHDRVSGKHLTGLKSGPEKYLTDEEEMELEEFLMGCTSVGFAHQCHHLKIDPKSRFWPAVVQVYMHFPILSF